MDEEMTSPCASQEEEDMTVGALCDSIETRMWLADAYFARGANGLAIECLRSAWMEYVRFRDVLRAYCGDRLGRELVQALVCKAGERALPTPLGEGDGAIALT